MLHAVIMAGGSGTRFWPESRQFRPKQLLKFAGERSLLQSTVDRLVDTVPLQRIRVVTGAAIVDQVAQQLPELSRGQLLAEPCRRDTAPCIAWAALTILQEDPEATLVVLPSDHVIQPIAAFAASLEQAERLVDESPRRIVTFGIRPTYPATSFGYIERGAALPGKAGDAPAFQVAQFREKPPIDVAQEYVAKGTFSWNSGIFVWRAATIVEALAQHQPELIAHIRQIVASSRQADAQGVLDREFAAIRGISIDYAVLEHARDVAVIEAPFGWEDVGSWQALARLHGTDEQGNTVIGRHLGVDTGGCIVRGSHDHLIVTLGLQDCLVVHTPDATFVANKNNEEAVREVVRRLQELGWQDVL